MLECEELWCDCSFLNSITEFEDDFDDFPFLNKNVRVLELQCDWTFLMSITEYEDGLNEYPFLKKYVRVIRTPV